MKKKLFTVIITMLMFFSISEHVSVYATAADVLYVNAYTAVVKCQQDKTQSSINQARNKINLLFKTDAAWAIGEFSKQVDGIQHPILVNIVNNIVGFDNIMKQFVIDETRTCIKDLPNEDWKNSYSSALDNCQQKLLNNVIKSYENLEKDKNQQNKNKCLILISELKTSISSDIVNFAIAYEEKVNKILIVSMNGELEVHFIDVGQADSILIQQGEHSMLIDAGNNEDGELVCNYIREQGIKNLDYVVGTHAHEDHIGGLDNVIKSFDIGTFYMTKKSNNTRTYEEVLEAASSKGLKMSEPKVGQTFKLGECTVTVVGPSKIYDDVNNCSIVLKVQYGNNSFLFTGDAENIAETDMINGSIDLKSDVIKVGHHGSYTSSYSEFLDKVKPEYAIIFVGKDNDYGYPHETVLNKYEKIGAKLYRTDLNGTIIITSDGNNIKIDL